MRKIILMTMVLMVLALVGYGADWKYIFTDTGGETWFYDTQSVSHEQDITSVWVKLVLSDQTKKNYIKTFPNILGIENINYIIAREEVDCQKNRTRVKKVIWYSSDAKPINNEDYPNEQFEECVPDSTSDKLVETICKKGEGGK